MPPFETFHSHLIWEIHLFVDGHFELEHNSFGHCMNITHANLPLPQQALIGPFPKTRNAESENANRLRHAPCPARCDDVIASILGLE